MARISTFFKMVALLAIMFGVSYNAEAQLLGGIAKAVKNKTTQSSQNKACTMPKPDAKAKPVTFSVGKNGEIAVCSWNPATLELTMLTEMSGNQKGDVIKLDPNTGKFTNNRGEDKGSISEDGTIVSPHLGVLKFEVKNAGVYGMEYKVLLKFPNGGSHILCNLKEEGSNSGDIPGTYTGKVNRLLAGYVYGALLLDKRMYTIKHKNYDPELKYTVEMLEDKIVWKNAAAEGEVMEYESSRPYAGFNREEHPELKNCKVAAVGLTSEWKESKWGEYSETTWEKTIHYWVVYELADGRNIVAFNYLKKEWGHKNGTTRGNNAWHEVSDWVRK